jgi:hypothetical protein
LPDKGAGGVEAVFAGAANGAQKGVTAFAASGGPGNGQQEALEGVVGIPGPDLGHS